MTRSLKQLYKMEKRLSCMFKDECVECILYVNEFVEVHCQTGQIIRCHPATFPLQVIPLSIRCIHLSSTLRNTHRKLKELLGLVGQLHPEFYMQNILKTLAASTLISSHAVQLTVCILPQSDFALYHFQLNIHSYLAKGICSAYLSSRQWRHRYRLCPGCSLRDSFGFWVSLNPWPNSCSSFFACLGSLSITFSIICFLKNNISRLALMDTSSSLQIPDMSNPGPSSIRQYRPVSVQPTTASPQQPSSRKRASHTVVSSNQQQQQQQDDQPAYRDVYSHPAAVAYAAAHPRRTIPKFGPYLLLQTLGEGEFGKVKLGLHSQWGEEVAVKLIRRGNIDSTVRMSKVEREIEVLRVRSWLGTARMFLIVNFQTLKHPNIVRLYDVIETDKYIGIILEYASGGELFDHILAHRYLKEKDAAKLFSQLISGVWYIHQKKIVHRDLKLENLLLDRHRNVIITDFGFANHFEHRSDDLMQTSCGSPCYAAPELVISEGLYVGSAVDIWSCGVILYAMLAGYLPFDDDPANPDGDNINLLYKYIVNTPLSFPDYISSEARDLLGMMLVPDPTRRADLRAIMQHSWLQPFANVFNRGVEDLERSAMDQHQLKRLAYQRQMRQAAAAAAVSNEPSHKMTRTQSARADPFNNSTSSRNHSQRSPPQVQPEYLYETSALDQSTNSPPVIPPGSRRGHSGTVIPSTSSPLDDDPFAPPSSSQDVSLTSIPIHVSPMDERSPRQKKSSKEHAPAVPVDVTPTKTPDTKKKGGFRHTIQVEYGDPEPQEALPTPSQSPASKPVPTSRKQIVNTDAVPAEERSTKRTRTVSHDSPASKRRPSGDDSASVKPLPQTPSSERSRPERAAPPRHTDGNFAATQKLPPTVSIAAATPPASPFSGEGEKSMVKRGTGSTGSRSSKHSGTHRRGLSVDKLGLGKIFGSGSGPAASTEQVGSNGISSRVPSESSTAESGSKHSVEPTVESDTSMLSPTEPNATKKNRRNTLTVMVEPFKTIKGRKAKTPVATGAPAQEKSRTPLSAVQAPPTPAISNNSKTELGVGMGIPASTNKANKVMQWFRSRSKGSGDPPNFTDGQPDELSVGDVEQEQVAPTTPTQASYRAPATSSTTTINQDKDKSVSGDRSHRALGATKRTASTATDHSFSPQTTGLANIVRTSFGIGSTPAKGVLRIHHGAVDHSTVTTKPPPEVMKHVKEVLESMGIDIRLESEFKYRCIRLKRRKGVNGVGLGLRDGGNGNGLAAFNIVGSAASNGVR